MSNPYITISQFNQLYDMKVLAQLSNDQQSSDALQTTIQMALDIQAGELESVLSGRVTLPITPQLFPASGSISLIGVPADNSTVTIGDGMMVSVFTFLSGGTATGQVDTSSGDTATIAGILGEVIGVSGLNLDVQENVTAVLLQNLKPGTDGNVAITTTSASVIPMGMKGGASSMPLILTKLVGVGAVRRMFARRGDLPPAIQADIEWADSWIAKFIATLVQIPGVPPAVTPMLIDSNFVDGRSQWDHFMGTCESPTGPTHG